MAWQNYEWSWKIRGLSVQLKHICTILANEASSSGLIDQLRHHRLANQCELSFDQTRRYIYELIDLGFIKERKSQYRTEGDQRANAYQLNLSLYHPGRGASSGDPAYPQDTTGPALWRFITQSFPRELRQPAQIHSEESQAFFNSRRALLHVWLAGRRDKSFFELHRPHLHQYADQSHKKVRSFEFIV